MATEVKRLTPGARCRREQTSSATGLARNATLRFIGESPAASTTSRGSRRRQRVHSPTRDSAALLPSAVCTRAAFSRCSSPRQRNLRDLIPNSGSENFSATVGDRKRVALQSAAIAAGLKVLNARTVKSKSKEGYAGKERSQGRGKTKKKRRNPQSPRQRHR